jgi:hypothetical protein
MNWILRMYPAQWRARYGEEFAEVLASQRLSAGMVLDVLGGAIDAHLYPQFQESNSEQNRGDDTMTLAMLHRCAAGGPKLSSDDRRIASLSVIFSALVLATLYIILTKTYRSAPAVQAVFYMSVPFLSLVYAQTAYLRKRSWATQIFVLLAGFFTLYLFMLATCVVGGRL